MDINFCFLKDENINDYVLLMKDAFSFDVDVSNVKKCLSLGIRVLCAMYDNKVVGAVMITNDYDPIRNLKSYYLDYVSVLSSYRNKKIGTKLMLEVENMAKKEDIDYIEFTSSNKTYARQLYLSSGYEIRDTSVFIKKYKGIY